jgi:hypothetical protein
LVEPRGEYPATWDLWRRANGLHPSIFHDYPVFCDNHDSERTVSLNTVYETLPERRCDILKMDIEGAREPYFRRISTGSIE